jgi:microcystin-dependent protein
MSDFFISEIRLFAGNYAPAGWAFCNGQILLIGQNTTLFKLIGTTYGGNGTTTFALPDLRGRVPMHAGQGAGLAARVRGQTGGVEEVTLSTQQIPVHTHQLLGSTGAGNANSPANNLIADGPATAFLEAAPDTNLSPLAAAPVGGSQPHENRMPYLVVSFIIALTGVIP